jgi:hypothetical protein
MADRIDLREVKMRHLNALLFSLFILVFTVINRPLFGLNEYQSLQMKQEIIDRVFETNRGSGIPCVIDGCSIRDLDGEVMVGVSWRVEEDGIWISKSIFFTISEVYYGSNIHQKLVIYKPFGTHKRILSPNIGKDYDGVIDRLEFPSHTRVYIEVPGGGGSGHNISIDNPPTPMGFAMLMRDITVAVIDYRPLLDFSMDPDAPVETLPRIAFIWEQYDDVLQAIGKIREMGFEVVGTYGHSYGAYLCSILAAKNPGLQGRLFIGAGIYNVFDAIAYWFHWFGVFLPEEEWLTEWSPGSTNFDGENTLIACPVFDTVVPPAHSFWLKDKWPNAILKEYPSDHDFAAVDKELPEDVIKWILYPESGILSRVE